MLRREKSHRLLFWVFVTALCTASTASGTVIYDNYSDPLRPSGVLFPYGYDPSPTWDSFTPPTTERLTTLSMVLFGWPPAHGKELLQVGLFEDNKTTPGRLITDIVSVAANHLSGIPVTEDPDDIAYRGYTFTVDTQPVVQAGTRYWIGLFNNPVASWCWTSQSAYSIGVAGEYHASSFPPSVAPNGGPYEMMLTGDPVASVPEPESAGVLALAGLLVFMARVPGNGTSRKTGR